MKGNPYGVTDADWDGAVDVAGALSSTGDGWSEICSSSDSWEMADLFSTQFD